MKYALALSAALTLIAAPAAFSQEGAPPAPSAPAGAEAATAVAADKDYSSADPIMVLIENDGPRGVLAKHIPEVVEFFDSGQGESVGLPETISLDEIAEFPEAMITPDMLDTINSELMAL